MLLVIDIGNTYIALGVYRGEELIARWQVTSGAYKTVDEYTVLLAELFARREVEAAAITGGVISCVVPPLLATFRRMFREYLGLTPLVVGPGLKTGVRIRTDDPREVGADRVVNALAARHFYGAPAIVIDFSTATIFDAVSATGDYLGNAIAPGLALSAEALFQHAARLPHVELARPESVIGKNTVASMQSGLLYGYVGLVEGMIARFQKELGSQAQVIATGNLAEIIAQETPLIQVVDRDLTLRGLRLIHEMNGARPEF